MGGNVEQTFYEINNYSFTQDNCKYVYFYMHQEMYRQTANNRELTFGVFEIYCKFAVDFESRIL